MPLVPAFAACTAPNRVHGSPLANASCRPPAQTSTQATVGTPEVFGGAPNATGRLRAWYRPCDGHCFPADEDIRINLALKDVRCMPTGARCGTANAAGPADYAGEMRFSFAIRLTDHWNAAPPGGATEAATVQDFTMDLPQATGPHWGCVQSASTAIGSTCDLDTSLNALIPAASQGGKRAVWELHAVRICDGGADGDGGTVADNTVFARPGIFIP
jgi:hypothetical protein